MWRLLFVGSAVAISVALAASCGDAPRTDQNAGSASATNGEGASSGLELMSTAATGSMICDGGRADAAPMASPCQASTAVSFATDIAPMLNGCTGEVCHSPWSYSSVVRAVASECCDGRLLVAPGDPQHSYLLDKLTNHDLCTGSPMPLDGPPIDATTTKALTDWICEGAIEN